MNAADRKKATPVLLRLPQVKAITGLSRTALYNRMRDGQFPQSVAIGDRAIGFVESEVYEWVNQRILARDQQDNPRKVA